MVVCCFDKVRGEKMLNALRVGRWVGRFYGRGSGDFVVFVSGVGCLEVWGLFFLGER